MTRIVGIVSLVAAGIVAFSSGAQDAASPDSGATFKIVKPPAPGTTHFITVQIDPAAQARALAALAPFPQPTVKPITLPNGSVVPGATPGAAQYGWFWNAVSPTLGDGSGRFGKALAALAQGPQGQAVAAPRMELMQQIAHTYGSQILTATVGTQVSPALALAVIGVESGGNSTAVSHSGARGLMQLVPATAARFGVADSFNTVDNIRGGVAYLDWLMKKFNGDPVMVLAAYNAGENTVISNNGVPPIAETRDYVPKVLAAWQVAQGLCMSPPELVSDGCVFRAVASAGVSKDFLTPPPDKLTP